MSYQNDAWPGRNTAITSLLVLQVVILWASVTEFSQISPFCGIPRNGMPDWIGHAHVAYLAMLGLGVAGLFVRRIGLFYIVALPLSLLFLPFQLWGLEHDYFYCDGP